MATPAAPTPDSGRVMVASTRNTVGLLLIQLGLAIGGAYFQTKSSPGPDLAPAHNGMATLYVSLIALEWGLVWYVWGGIHDRGFRLLDLVGGRWSSWKNVALDLAIALPFWAVWAAVARLVQMSLGENHAKGARLCFRNHGSRLRSGWRFRHPPAFAKRLSFAGISKGSLKH